MAKARKPADLGDFKKRCKEMKKDLVRMSSDFSGKCRRKHEALADLKKKQKDMNKDLIEVSDKNREFFSKHILHICIYIYIHWIWFKK